MARQRRIDYGMVGKQRNDNFLMIIMEDGGERRVGGDVFFFMWGENLASYLQSHLDESFPKPQVIYSSFLWGGLGRIQGWI